MEIPPLLPPKTPTLKHLTAMLHLPQAAKPLQSFLKLPLRKCYYENVAVLTTAATSHQNKQLKPATNISTPPQWFPYTTSAIWFPETTAATNNAATNT
mmetsp:Transcript_43284/g.50700  ORF Transcript_43284/g.50700 Transcript_43284/m.50700 type:complete len:98 (-) Transcript_43284:191-484(-)